MNGWQKAAAFAIVLALVVAVGKFAVLKPGSFLLPDYPNVYYDFNIPDPVLNLVGDPAAIPPQLLSQCRTYYDGNGRWQRFECNSTDWQVIFDGGGSVSQGNGQLSMTSSGNGVTVRTRRDIGSVDWRVKGTLTVTSVLNRGSLSIGTETTSSGITLSPPSGTTPTSATTGYAAVDGVVVTSRFNESEQEASINGQASSVAFYKGGPRYLQISVTGHGSSNPYDYATTTTFSGSVRYRPVFGCGVGQGEVLGDDTYPGSYAVSALAFSRTPVRYCAASVFKSGVGASFDEPTTSELFTRLINGETLFVPADQIWRLFYVFKNDGTIFCSGNESFDFSTNGCGQRTGLASFCKGNLDPVTGVCSTSLADRCRFIGGFYNTQDGSCYRAYPNQGACPYFNAAYIPEYGKCLASLQQSDCLANSGTWNQAQGWCEWQPIYLVRCSNPLAAVDPISGNCTVFKDTTYLPGSQCNGTLTQPSPGSFVCRTQVVEQPIVTYEQPKCDGVLLKTAQGVYVCKVQIGIVLNDTTVVVNNQSVLTFKPSQAAASAAVPAWVYVAIGAAVVSGLAYLIVRLKKV